jgi:uncharacterized protein
MDDREAAPGVLVEVSAAGKQGEALLALNNAHARELSRLDTEQFGHLVAEAFQARAIGRSLPPGIRPGRRL